MSFRQGARQFFERRGAPTPSVPTARDYVQDGLIAMWDGIENAGWGVHDAAATTLKNLAVDGMLDISLNGSYTITDNSVRFTGGYGIADKYDFTGLSGATISVLASYKATNRFNSNGWSFAGAQPRLAAYYDNGGWYLTSRNNPAKISDSFTVDITYRYDFIWDVTNSIIRVYKNGVEVGSATDSPSLGYTANHFRMMAYGSSSDGNYQTSNGEVFNCMVYTKALPADEIAANYAIDKARFNLP